MNLSACSPCAPGMFAMTVTRSCSLSWLRSGMGSLLLMLLLRAASS